MKMQTDVKALVHIYFNEIHSVYGNDGYAPRGFK